MSDLETAAVKRVMTSKTFPNLLVIDKENGGKADALNTGIKYSRNALFCAMDADTLLHPHALIRVAMPFLEDKTTIAAGGAIRIINGCDVHHGHIREIMMPSNLLAGIQVVEYARAFMLGRLGWDKLGGLLIISGAFGIFKRDVVLEVGGFSTTTIGEDMELVVRLHRHYRERKIPYKVSFIPEPLAWTECPEDMVALGKQRARWQRGLMETLGRHIKMMFNPHYGVIGMAAMPYFAIFEMISPVIEFLGVISLTISVINNQVSLPFASAFMFLALVLGLIPSLSSITLMELTFNRYASWRGFARLVGLALLENFTYRPWLVMVRMRGTIDGLRGKKGWDHLTKKGFGTAGGTS